MANSLESVGQSRDALLQRLLDKEAIRECLMLYSRGMDRRDRSIIEAVYWPEAIDYHLSFKGTGNDFIDFAFKVADGMLTHHMLGNVLMDFVSPTEAHTETYYLASHERTVEGGREDFIIHGRYLDRFEKRGDEWRVLERTLTCDMYSMRPSTADWKNGIYAGHEMLGGVVPNDPIYRVFSASKD